MKKKPYRKPQIKEVKLAIEDTLLTACRSARFSTAGVRRGTFCSSCRTTYRVS